MATNKRQSKSRQGGAPVRKRETMKATARTTKPRAGSEIPDEAHVEQVVAGLEPADQSTVRAMLAALAAHLGSPEAARLWLITRAPEFGTTPLAAIGEGKAKLVRAVLESRWGRRPTYA